MSWTSIGLNLSEQWFISQGGVDSWWALKSRVKIAVSFYWTCMSLWKVPFGFMNKAEILGSAWFPASCWIKVPGFSYSSMWIFKFVVSLLQVESSLMGDVPVTWSLLILFKHNFRVLKSIWLFGMGTNHWYLVIGLPRHLLGLWCVYGSKHTPKQLLPSP